MFPYLPVHNHADLLAVVDGLLQEAGLSRSDFGGEIMFEGMDPIRPTHIKVACASAAVGGANAIAFRNLSGVSDQAKPKISTSILERPMLSRVPGKILSWTAR